MKNKTPLIELIETLEHWANSAINLSDEKREGILIASEQAKRLLKNEKLEELYKAEIIILERYIGWDLPLLKAKKNKNIKLINKINVAKREIGVILWELGYPINLNESDAMFYLNCLKSQTIIAKELTKNEFKAKQKELLIEMMRGDEELGLYDNEEKDK